MLVWARMERGMIPFNPKEILLAPLLRESTEPLLELAASKTIELKFEVEPYETVYADKYLIQTILRNLVSNALKFTNSGGVVSVTAARNGGMIEVSVTDSGIGISQEMQKNLFKFMSVNNRKGTEGEPSTGLGLVVCKDFAEKMGGSLNVESVPGSGSRFFFTVPAHHPDK
jgi:signal transduction histidine kinase